jgi:TPP-dependent pyruvate/acetoin dehydrogenase alpha subunit
MTKDCILDFEKELLKSKVVKKQNLEEIGADLDREIEEAVLFARECPYPEVSEMTDGLYL